MATKPLIKESLQILNLCGLKPGKQNTRTIVQAVLLVTMYIYSLIEIAFQLAYNWEGLDSMDGFNQMAMFYQALFKSLVILVYRQVFGRILFRVGQFWDLDKYGHEVKTEILNILKSCRNNIKMFMVLFAASVSMYLLKPFFSVVRILPLLMYHPTDYNKSPQYELAYCMQAGVVIWGASAICAFDILFISFVIHIVNEIKILKHGFLTMKLKEKDEKCCLREIKVLVEHHNLVLESIKDLDKIYSSMLLNQFLASLVCTCGGLLSLIGNGFPPDLQHFLKYVTLVTTILSQLFIYCLAGSYLITESESLSEAAYKSDWWVKTQPKVRRAYVLVIQRANKTEKLTAGGMFILNLESFTSVVRTSLSFFTLLQALYRRTEQSRS